MKPWRLWIGSLGLSGYLLAGLSAAAAAPVQVQQTDCAAEQFTLVRQLLRDLPSYANRAHTLLGIPNQYVVVASQPEFQPLPLGPGQRAAQVEQAVDPEDPYQIFFTTLERSYQDGKLVRLQEYHWLFLTRSQRGWRLALLYSMIGPYTTEGPPLPPRDSSEGSLAYAIRTWLRDYRSQCGSTPANAYRTSPGPSEHIAS